MKTIFQMGLPRNNNVFWMGQPLPADFDRADMCGKLTTAMDQYGIAANFQAQPNYRQLLGADADRFDTMKNGIDQDYSDVLNAQSVLCAGGASEITKSMLMALQDFIANSAELAKIVQAHSAKPVVPGAKPSVPAPSSGPSPLLIGGIAAAGVAVVALVLKG